MTRAEARMIVAYFPEGRIPGWRFDESAPIVQEARKLLMTVTPTTRPSATLYPDDPRRADALRLGARNGSGVGQDRHRIRHADTWVERHPVMAELARAVITLAVLVAAGVVGGAFVSAVLR